MWFFKAILQLATLAIIASCQLVAASPPESAGHVEIPPNTSIESLLGHAQSHLSRGEAHEALAYYDAAVARHPFDYLTLFKRASAQLLLGKPSLAAHDFNRALELEPDFEGAHIQLAKIRIRLGDWEGAMDHYIRAHKAHDSPEMLELNEAQGAAALADVAQSTAAWEECTRQANLAISVAPRSSSLRQIRAHCRLEMGEIEAAIVDLKHVLQLQPADTAGYVNMSAITMYGLADTQEAMALARQCLQSDPDSKPCRNLLTKEKAITNALDKVIRSIRKTPMTATRMLVGTADNSGLIPDVRRDMEELTRQGILPLLAPKKLYSRLVDLACQGYHETENKNAQGYCEESLELNPVSLYGLLYRAKVHIGNEAFDAAIELYEKALENHTQEGGLISRLMQEARISLRRSQSKDYYKVLGLSRDADDRQIKSAYRKLSKQYHPDKVISNGITKDEAEKKMAQINEAYEVLGDSELRARFDQGDDPNSQHGFDHRTDRRAHHFGPGDPFQNMFRSGEGIKFRAGRGGGFQHGFAFN